MRPERKEGEILLGEYDGRRQRDGVWVAEWSLGLRLQPPCSLLAVPVPAFGPALCLLPSTLALLLVPVPALILVSDVSVSPTGSRNLISRLELERLLVGGRAEA